MMKILNLTYYSLSGVISHIILRNSFKNIRYLTCGYEKLDKNIHEIYLEPGEKLICSNFVLNQQQYDYLYKLDNKLIYIDHHLGSKELQLKDNKNILNQKYSSCLLTYMIFEKFIKDNREKLKKLAILGHVYDKWEINSKNFNSAYFLNEIFWKYNFDSTVERFKNGFTGFEKNEKIYVNDKIKDKWKRLKKLNIKELDGLDKKNAVLVLLNKEEYDLINDVQVAYKKYDIYFIYLMDKMKLIVKHKLNHIMYDILKKLFKNRDDVEFFGNSQYGTLNYKKITNDMFISDLKIILSRM